MGKDKSESKLAVKRQAFSLAGAAILNSAKRLKEIREWAKEAKSNVKAFEKAKSDYMDELTDYGIGGDNAVSDESANAVDAKTSLIDDLSEGWLQTVIEDVVNTLNDYKTSPKEFEVAFMKILEIQDPTEEES